MAYYTYDCKKCGRMELQKRMTEPEFKECPTCKGELTRVYIPIADLWKCGGNFGKSNNNN
jgi:putative FmdB family regulatory protein